MDRRVQVYRSVFHITIFYVIESALLQNEQLEAKILSKSSGFT